MDLVAGVRKEGSRGGRDSFRWEDVKDDQHRENYLGHSLMAPVGRWQKNKDLSWYAKGDDSQAATDAANARAEEIRRIKEAEQDALSAALGFPVEPRIRNTEVAGPKEVEKAMKEAGDVEQEGGRGVGFGGFVGNLPLAGQDEVRDTMIGHIGNKGGLEGGDMKVNKLEKRRKRSRSRDRERGHKRRSRSRDKGRRYRHRHNERDEIRSHRRHRSRSRDRHLQDRSQSRSRERRRDDDRYPRPRTERSHSPIGRRRRSREHHHERKRREIS